MFCFVVVTCPQLDNPPNGEVSVEGQTVGSTANYVCDIGFELIGVLKRVCLQDGQWSDDEPSCIRTYLWLFFEQAIVRAYIPKGTVTLHVLTNNVLHTFQILLSSNVLQVLRLT